MDGGKDGGEDGDTHKARDVVLRYLRIIDKELRGFLGNKPLRFDAWVVTHWDDDHYTGVLQLLQEKSPTTLGQQEARDFVARFKEGCSKLYCGHKPPSDIMKTITKIFEPKGPLFGTDLIGLDLFSGHRIFQHNLHGTLPDTPSPKNSRPVFCVFAAGGCSIRTQVDQKKVPKNDCSIISILSWPSHNARCSLFTGGDGNPQLEKEAIVGSLREPNGVAWLPEDDGIFLMKLDHHGSSAQTFYTKGEKAKNFLKHLPIVQLRPYNILITPGNRYGHPTYDVIHLLKRAFKQHSWGKTNNENAMKTVGRVFGTRTPYWAKAAEATKDAIPISHNNKAKMVPKEETPEHVDAGTGYEDDAKREIHEYETFTILDNWRKWIANELEQSTVNLDTEQEPEKEAARSDWLDYLVINLENRQYVKFASEEEWQEISEQPIDEYAGVTKYYLIRSSFVDGEPQEILWTTDGKDWNGDEQGFSQVTDNRSAPNWKFEDDNSATLLKKRPGKDDISDLDSFGKKNKSDGLESNLRTLERLRKDWLANDVGAIDPDSANTKREEELANKIMKISGVFKWSTFFEDNELGNPKQDPELLQSGILDVFKRQKGKKQKKLANAKSGGPNKSSKSNIGGNKKNRGVDGYQSKI
ncbi:hypothetical protein FDECE_694 [Fusarium decemcellulare]|nr:hypothetical protein FDECE_694 [Fusarium decemcellulare]